MREDGFQSDFAPLDRANSPSRATALTMIAPLYYFSQVLDDSLVGPVRDYAFAKGRVLSCEAISILTWGIAERIELTGGISNLSALLDAQKRIDQMVSVDPFPNDKAKTAFAGTGTPSGGAQLAGIGDLMRPIAIAALPFDRNRTASLLIPRVAVIHNHNGPLVAIVAGTQAQIAESVMTFPFTKNTYSSVANEISPDNFELTSPDGHESFINLVAKAVAAIDAGHFEKVVLAREVRVRANRPFPIHQLMTRMEALHPSTMRFSIDGFLGATPELLIARNGNLATSIPLAGTIARSGDQADDARLTNELLASQKDNAEHNFVVTGIRQILARYATSGTDNAKPHLLQLRNVSHLATKIEAKLDDPVPSILELIGALHPTPAVGGWPTDRALDFIQAHENLDRGRYAGPIGYVRAGGDGAFWLGIRSAAIDGPEARLMAGVGIVEGSDPDDELAETQLKLQALLAVVVRP